MGINSIDQLLVLAYSRGSHFDASSVPAEIHQDVEDYKRINSIILRLEESAGSQGIVAWETVMNIFEMSQGQYGIVETSDDLKQILHMGLGTEVDEVKGIGTSADGITKENIYLGYSKHFPVVSEESSVTAERWHFIPRYNYPVVTLQIVPNGVTVGVQLSQGVNGERKNELARYYKNKGVEGETEEAAVQKWYSHDSDDYGSDSGDYQIPVQMNEYDGSYEGFDDAYGPTNRDITLLPETPAVAFQEEQIIQIDAEKLIETEQTEKLEVFNKHEGTHQKVEDDIVEEAFPEKPITIQQKARALLDKVTYLSDPQKNEDGIYLSMPRHIMEVDDVMEALSLTSQEIHTSKKNPFMLLQGLMDSSFPHSDICVERIELKKKVGAHMQHIVWRIRNKFDERETIDVTLVSPAKGGKWTAGSLTVRKNEAQRNFRKSLTKKTDPSPKWKNVRNTESKPGYVQASLFAEP